MRTWIGAAAAIAAAGCGRHEGVTPPLVAAVTDTTLTVPSSLTSLRLITYDGSGQVVHPDFLTPIKPWSHKPRYLAVTPYPGSNRSLENPSLYNGGDGMHWTVDPGTPNPVAWPQTGFLSDPDIVYASFRNEIFLYYRQSDASDDIFLARSVDGVAWGDGSKILTGAANAIISPAVVRRSRTEWWMWSINAIGGCDGPRTVVERRQSSDGITWSEPTPVEMDLGQTYAWHIDVQWIPSLSEYWALAPVKEPGTCITQRLQLLTSADGLHWTAARTPVAYAGVIPAFHDIVYRSTFAYDPSADAVTLWISGARFDGGLFIWGTAAERRSRAELFAAPPTRAALQMKPARLDPKIAALFVPPA